MKMKSILAVMAALVFTFAVSSCGSKTTPAATNDSDQEEIITPFADWASDADYFRFVGTGSSRDQATAGKIARLNARSEFAQSMEVLIKNVSKSYTNQVQVEDEKAYENSFEELAIAAAKQTLNNSVQKQSKLFKSKSTGEFTAYSAMELPKNVVVEAVKKSLTADQRTAVAFDEFMFKKTFDEEMQKLEAEQANR